MVQNSSLKKSVFVVLTAVVISTCSLTTVCISIYRNGYTKKKSSDSNSVLFEKNLKHNRNRDIMINSKMQQNPAFTQVAFDLPIVEAVPYFDDQHPTNMKLMINGLSNGLNISNDSIGIRYTGLYYLYSNIHWLAGVNCSEVIYQQWMFYIRVTKSDATNVTLLKMVHTCCYNCSESEDTQFIGGLFYLQVGDVITAACSGHSLVKASQESSFIGLLMLKSGLDDLT